MKLILQFYLVCVMLLLVPVAIAAFAIGTISSLLAGAFSNGWRVASDDDIWKSEK